MLLSGCRAKVHPRENDTINGTLVQLLEMFSISAICFPNTQPQEKHKTVQIIEIWFS